MNKTLWFLLTLLLAAACSKPAVPEFSLWQQKHKGSYVALTDRDGLLLQEGRIDFRHRQLGWHALNSFSKELQRELVALEDQRFWQHSGVDWKAMVSSAYGQLKSTPRGGSTVSMQVTNMLYPKLRQLKDYKLEQIRLARSLEEVWSKEQILETYLNFVPMRGEVRGFPAAARVFYGKGHDQLFFSERLWLYSFLPAPNADWSVLSARACRYGKRLVANYDCRELEHFRPQARPMRPQNLAPHLMSFLRPELSTTTSLSRSLQIKTSEILRRHLLSLRAHNVKDGAVLVADRQTGEVLAYVGGIETEASASHVDHVQAPRQAGSTLKPFLYAQALQLRLLTLDSPILDAPFSISDEGFTYRPENHDRLFLQRPVPLKEALASSLNIPAIRTIDLVTPLRFYDLLTNMGFKLPFDSEFYGHSMALGSVDVTLKELVQGYLSLSRGAQAPQLSFVRGESTLAPTPFSDEVSSILAHILSEKSYRVHTFGLMSVLNTSSWSAVKTGTSKDMRDNWCVGFTDRYVVGVWAGNSSGEPMWDVLGISGAGPIWREVVDHLHAHVPSKLPVLHASLVKKNGSYFLPGTEPLTEDLTLVKKTLARITSPTAFGEYAYDPDIPARGQRIQLKTEGIVGARWRLNGVPLSEQTIKEGLSVETRGKYVLELLNELDEKQDEVKFFVKAGKAEGL